MLRPARAAPPRAACPQGSAAPADDGGVSLADGPPPTESTNCILHTFQPADRICSACGAWHCDSCLVTPFGPRKGALCVSCAIERGGVRKTSGQAPKRTPSDIRQLEKQIRKQQRDEERRPVVVSPLGLEKLDMDAPKRRGLFRRK